MKITVKVSVVATADDGKTVAEYSNRAFTETSDAFPLNPGKVFEAAMRAVDGDIILWEMKREIEARSAKSQPEIDDSIANFSGKFFKAALRTVESEPDLGR